MATEIDSRVTPALHADNVKSIDGYDDDTAAFLAPTMTAFDEAYHAISRVHDARAAAARNPTLNDAAQVIATQDLADKLFAKAARGFDSTRANLARGIEHLEKELSAPLESKAAHGISAEVRAHAKSLSDEKRHALIRQAIEQGDEVTASAILGTVPYLSGLDAQFSAIYTRQWREKANPGIAKRLKAMQGAKAMIEERAGLVFEQLEKAVGMRPDKVKRLRDAKTKSEQAFVLGES
jgi:hypothetical protein